LGWWRYEMMPLGSRLVTRLWREDIERMIVPGAAAFELPVLTVAGCRRLLAATRDHKDGRVLVRRKATGDVGRLKSPD